MDRCRPGNMQSGIGASALFSLPCSLELGWRVRPALFPPRLIEAWLLSPAAMLFALAAAAWGALLGRRLSQRGVLVFCLDYRNLPQAGLPCFSW